MWTLLSAPAAHGEEFDLALILDEIDMDGTEHTCAVDLDEVRRFARYREASDWVGRLGEQREHLGQRLPDHTPEELEAAVACAEAGLTVSYDTRTGDWVGPALDACEVDHDALRIATVWGTWDYFNGAVGLAIAERWPETPEGATGARRYLDDALAKPPTDEVLDFVGHYLEQYGPGSEHPSLDAAVPMFFVPGEMTLPVTRVVVGVMLEQCAHDLEAWGAYFGDERMLGVALACADAALAADREPPDDRLEDATAFRAMRLRYRLGEYHELIERYEAQDLDAFGSRPGAAPAVWARRALLKRPPGERPWLARLLGRTPADVQAWLDAVHDLRWSELSVSDVLAIHPLGQLHWRDGRVEEIRVLKGHQAFIMARFEAASVLWAHGREDEALQALQALMRLAPREDFTEEAIGLLEQPVPETITAFFEAHAYLVDAQFSRPVTKKQPPWATLPETLSAPQASVRTWSLKLDGERHRRAVMMDDGHRGVPTDADRLAAWFEWTGDEEAFTRWLTTAEDRAEVPTEHARAAVCGTAALSLASEQRATLSSVTPSCKDCPGPSMHLSLKDDGLGAWLDISGLDTATRSSAVVGLASSAGVEELPRPITYTWALPPAFQTDEETVEIAPQNAANYRFRERLANTRFVVPVESFLAEWKAQCPTWAEDGEALEADLRAGKLTNRCGQENLLDGFLASGRAGATEPLVHYEQRHGIDPDNPDQIQRGWFTADRIQILEAKWR